MLENLNRCGVPILTYQGEFVRRLRFIWIEKFGICLLFPEVGLSYGGSNNLLMDLYRSFSLHFM